MPTIQVRAASKKAPRDLSQLLKTPNKPLTASQIKNFDEYMSFKNHGVSARDVSITDSVNDAIANFDRYLGIAGA
jgi:wobble nucleotide-excising tRNase